MRTPPVLHRLWIKFTSAAKDAAKDDSGQAALVLITLVIVAAGITISQMSVQNNRRTLEVQQGQRNNFDKITNAIDVFAIQDVSGNNDFLLPCPGAIGGNGAAQGYVGGTTCNGVNRGIVPWVTLGLAEEDVLDANGNYITYIVHSTVIGACNGTNPTTDSLGEFTSGTNFAYALVGHGQNGFGAFNSAGNQVAVGSMSTIEQRNCPTVGCATGADQFVSGPASETNGATFFDDVVRAVSFAETFTEECMVLAAETDEELGNGGSAITPDYVTDNAVVTDDANTNYADVVRPSDNNGTPADITDDTRVVRFSDRKPAESTAACIWFEPAIQVRDSKVRILTEFTARNDITDTRGGGAVFGFMSYDPDVNPSSGTPDENDDSGYLLTNLVCGGTSSFMGFADETGVLELPSVPRFGVEVDTRSENGSAGEGGNTNQDSTVDFGTANAAWNHVAILGSNNDHMGNSQTDTGDFGDAGNGDGPVCIDGLAGSNLGTDGSGCATPANVTLTAPVAGDSGVIEVGDNTPATGDFHQMRMDITYEGGSCATDQIFVQYWLYLGNGTNDADCAGDGSNCTTLTEDFDLGGSTPAATKSFCVPWTADFNDEYMRFGFTTGQPAGATSIVDQFTIRRFDFNSIPKSGLASGSTAAAGTRSREIHNVNAVDEVFGVVHPAAVGVVDTGMGLVDLDNSTAQTHFQDDRIETGVRFVSRNGVLDAQFDGATGGQPDPLSDNSGIGIRGIGSDTTNEIDMLWQRVTSGAPDLGIYPNASNPGAREALEIMFYADDDSSTSTLTAYHRLGLNLGRFTLNATTAEGDLAEEVIVRAFSGGTLVGDNTIPTCINSTSANNHMYLTMEYETAVDRIILIPDIITTGSSPATYPDDEYGSDFYIRGIKGCSAESSCAPMATNDCRSDYMVNSSGVASLTDTYPYGGLGDPTSVFDVGDMTGLITLNNIQSHFNSLNSVDLVATGGTGQTLWQNFEGNFSGLGDPDDDGPVYVDILEPSNLYIRLNENNTNAYDEGIWVGGGRIQSNNNEAVEFRWHNEWNTALITFGHFGQVGNNGDGNPDRLERATVQGFSGTNGATSEGTATVISCADVATHGAGTDATGVTNMIVNFPAGQNINRLVVTPAQTGLGSNTEFVINGIRMCTEAAGCTTTDFGSMDGAETCTATFNAI